MGKQVPQQPKTAKAQLLQGILAAGLRVFESLDLKNIAQGLGLDQHYTLSLISGLIREGWIQAIKRGVYKLNAVTGVSPIHEFEIAMHLVKPAMISYYSAFYHHGLSEQVPRRIYISTLKESATPQGGIRQKAGFHFEGIDYQVAQLKKEKFFGAIQAWRGEGSFWVSNLERTLIEGFASPQHCGGFGAVMQGLQEALPKLHLEQLLEYAGRWDIAVGRRLGWALEQVGIKDEAILSLAQVQHPGYRILDPSSPATGPYARKWRLQINV
jgi:predicted transcriptional regulator of viral defense system